MTKGGISNVALGVLFVLIVLGTIYVSYLASNVHPVGASTIDMVQSPDQFGLYLCVISLTLSLIILIGLFTRLPSPSEKPV